MNEETEVYTIYQRVTQIETRHVTAPKGLTFDQLSDWVDENGVEDLLDIDELDNDMVSADYEDGSHVKEKLGEMITAIYRYERFDPPSTRSCGDAYPAGNYVSRG